MARGLGHEGLGLGVRQLGTGQPGARDAREGEQEAFGEPPAALTAFSTPQGTKEGFCLLSRGIAMTVLFQSASLGILRRRRCKAEQAQRRPERTPPQLSRSGVTRSTGEVMANMAP